MTDKFEAQGKSISADGALNSDAFASAGAGPGVGVGMGMGEGVGPTAGEGKLDLKVALGWSVGSLGTGTLLVTVNTLFLKYIVDHLLIGAALAGTIITVTRLFDAAIDPFMGSISDRTRSRWGRRRPYLLLGGIMCAASVALLFSDPFGVASEHAALYVTIVLCFYAVAYTIFSVPYITMSYEITQSPRQRTSLMSFRVYATAVGGLVGQALAPWIITAAGGGKEGFAMMGWTLCAIVLVACLIAFAGTAKARVVPLSDTATSPRLRDMTVALGNKPFLRLISAKASYNLGTGIQAAALAFFLTTALEKDLAILGVLSASLLICMILSQPVWVWICNRLGKRMAFFIAFPTNALANLSWFLAEPGEPVEGFIIRGIFIGLSGGGMSLVIQAMLPDVLQHEAERTEMPQEGVLAGIFTTIERGISAISVAIAGLIMGFAGYVAGELVQSERAIQALYICVGLMPCLGMIGAVLILRGYSLRD